jgi:hypothetical protein
MTYFQSLRKIRIQSMIALGLAALALSACESAQGTTAHSLGDEVDTTFYSLVEGEKQGPGTVTVVGVRPGEVAELVDAGFDVDVDAGTTSVLYVDVRFTNVGDVPVDLREPSGIDGNGNLVPSLTVVDLGAPTFDLCPAVPDTLEPGAAIQGCSIVLVPDGVEVEQISYLADASEDFVYWRVP